MNAGVNRLLRVGSQDVDVYTLRLGLRRGTMF